MNTATLELTVGQWQDIVRGLNVLAEVSGTEEGYRKHLKDFASEIEELVIVQTN